ncbi:MAG: hypothetical protein HFI33_13600 [Lachnospiraceae bacterium]|nr:hypothetical protein [Lachnospiraceae bacterium]
MKKKMLLLCFLVLGSIIKIIAINKYIKRNIIKLLLVLNKRQMSFRLMNQWVKVKQKGKNLSEYFELAGYRKIAIYGMGYIGETLLSELNGTKTEVLYGIDQNADTIYANIDILSLKDDLQRVDVVVVTAVNSFEAISENIKKKLDCPVVSIIDVVYDI